MAVTLASPAAFVVAGVPAMTAVAPEPGGVKTTDAPATGFPRPSVTNATSGAPNAAPMAAL